jgi:ATP/maltotriose-dependent transcriptional regulator MalT
VLVQYATAEIGAILVTVNPAYRAVELEYTLRQSEVAMVIAAPHFKTTDYAAMLGEAAPRCPGLRDVVLLDSVGWDELAATVAERLPVVAGGLHHRAGDPLGDQMLTQRQDLARHRAPGRNCLNRFVPPRTGDAHAHFGVPFRDIQPGTAGMQDFHRPSLPSHAHRPGVGGKPRSASLRRRKLRSRQVMVEFDPFVTRHDAVGDIAAELATVGFSEPKEIGRGGFGVVYRCTQRSLDRTVAVKVLTADLDTENLGRFVREQRAMGRLSGHPNIVNVLEIGATASGRPFIVMQYHPLGTLDALIRKNGPLDWSGALRGGIKLAGALETAHQAGILHRDVKPANILLTEYGEPELTDFGIARMAGAFETRAGLIAGTPAFTAPEVLSGAEPTVASDVYGLGATLFCALTGHAAFERQSGESMIAQFVRLSSEPVPDLRALDIPKALSSAVERAMARDPEERPTSAGEFGAELGEIGRRIGFGADEMALRVHAAEDSLLAGAGPLTSGTGRRTLIGSGSAPPTPATKFRRPRGPRAQVPRDRLIEALRAGEHRRLTVIHAPAGYGKTTLAAQWGEELGREGVKVAWLTVDDNDNNLVWFLSNLVEAIRRADPAVARGLGEVLEESGEDAQQYVLTSLVNEIAERDERVAIIVDDWHRVTAPGVVGAMTFLLDHGGYNVHVVVASRSHSGLPVSRMLVRDELTEIDLAALCFDEAEARSFLVDVAGLDLKSNDVIDLRNATGGWVAALQLASLSLRGADTPAEAISQISGRHHAIADFLAENVLSALEPEMLRFLLTTSITAGICGSLACALSGEPRGQAMLEEVEARDLFLRRTDQNGDWFRYEDLFAEFLRRRLDRDHPELTIPLHRKASEWFADRKMLVEAVDHALAADDTRRAFELVESDGLTLLENSQHATLLGLVDKLPAAVVASSPRLQMALAWLHALLHHTDRARAALQRVDAALTTMQDSGTDVTDLRAAANVVRATLRAAADRTDGLDELISECLARPDRSPPVVVALAANMAIYSAICRFDFDAAYHWQEWSSPYHKQQSGPLEEMYGHALAGVAAFEQLDLDRAEQCFRTAQQVSCRKGAVHSHAARIAGALLAHLIYERGETADAQRLLAESFKLGADQGIVEVIIARFVLGVRLAVLRGDRAAAADLLDDGAEVAQRLSTPRLGASIENERVRLRLPTRRPIAPLVEFAQRQRQAEGIAEITAQLQDETAIRALIADSGVGEHNDVAREWAQEWVDRLQGRGRDHALLRAQRTLAECLAAAGRTVEAKQLLGTVLARCADLRMVRFPNDGGPRLIPLIAELRDDQQMGRFDPMKPQPPISFLDQILDAAAPGTWGMVKEEEMPTA